MPKKNPPRKKDSSAKDKVNLPITGFRISNFKAFAGSQYIPIRPLTLIYGANSSGKSSVLHSLLLAHHAITNEGELDVYRTEAGGDSVDLGGFGQYVHKRKRSNVIEWTVDLDPKCLNLQNIELNVDHLENLLKEVNKLTVRILIGISPAEKGRVRVLAFFLEADNSTVLRMSHIPGTNTLKLNDISDSPIINHLIDAILGRITSTSTPPRPSRQELQKAIDELVPNITAEVSHLLPTQQETRYDDDLSPVNRKSELTTEDFASILASLFVAHFTSLIELIHDAVEEEIGRLQYLGPFRTYPPRHFAFSRQKDANWEAGGGHAWDILLNNAEVRKKVNAWLGDGDRMKTPYELKVRNLFSDTEVKKTIDSRITNKLLDLTTQLMFYAAGLAEPEIKDKIEQLKASLEAIGTDFEDFEQILDKLQKTNSFEVIKELTSVGNHPQGHPLHGILVEIEAMLSSLADTDSLSDDWVQKMTLAGDRILDLVLIDKRNDTIVSHRDVGIGISQVIPVLVYCYGLSDALIAIEQPEIHLHPRLQAELGSVFAESIKPPYNNSFILETHSEHLILRLQKLIRKGQLKPEDVSVIYVNCDSKGSQCLELRLDEEGDFIDEWPDGFFDDDFQEMFS